ncbi:MAG: lytic transglycosylase domain-containing protein [Nocardioidaceae bacterium]|nr:lytic transglycosylase domain-containing protein [Nocardioidaceae bacterium]
MPETHVTPRHKAPRSVTRSASRLAVKAAAVVPAPRLTGALALMGAAGIAVNAGVAVQGNADATDIGPATADLAVSSLEAIDTARLAARGTEVQSEARRLSRSDDRPALPIHQRATKAASLPLDHQELDGAMTERVEPPQPTDPRALAQSMLPAYGWSSSEFSCLDQLWVSESDWDPTAINPTSGAYGIPQSLPAEKMATTGSDWRTNPATQIAWGLGYIRDSYGTPCGAWSFKQGNNWY